MLELAILVHGNQDSPLTLFATNFTRDVIPQRDYFPIKYESDPAQATLYEKSTLL